jgi:dTDP-4-dehydrorhamnose reductase
VNVYGSTKLAGERAVLEDDPTTLVIHTTGVFGPEKQGKNFVYQLCNAFAEKKDMDCARDSFGSPTYNRDLAVMTVSLLEARATGIYHGVGPETLDRHSFAMLIADTFGLDSKFVKSFNSQALNQNTVDRLGFAARRGKHLGLSNQKVKDALPISCHHRSITEALQHWKDNPRGAECKF